MALINQNNIIGITSITSPGASNVLTFHTSDTTERLRVTPGGLSFSRTNSSLDSSGNASFNGNVSIGGTLTYEDVTNIDAVGVVTARSGIHVTGGSVGIGTDNPGEKLVVQGPVVCKGTLSVGQTSAGVLDFSGNDLRIRCYGATTGSGSFSIRTGGGAGNVDTERLRITSAGQLNLAGNMQFTAADPELEFNNGGPRFRVPAANTLTIHTGGGLGATTNERLRITSDGKVGIGENSPETLLHLKASTAPILTIQNTTNTSYTGIQFDRAADDTQFAIYSYDSSHASQANNVQFYNYQSGALSFHTSSTERLRIDSTGHFGFNIGTGNGYTAQFNDTAGSMTLHLTNATTGTGSGDGSRITASTSGILYIENQEASDISFWSNGSERLCINSTGQLQATGAADVRLTLGSGGTAGTNNSVHMRADGANLLFMNASGGLTKFESNGTETLRVSSDGEVTKPLQPRFHARLLTDQTSYDGRNVGGTWIIYNTTDYDIGNNFVTSGSDQGRFVAPVSGLYLFQAAAYIWSGNPGWSQSWFDVDGSRKQGTDFVMSSAFDKDFAQNSAQIYLTTGQKIGFHPYNNNNGNTVPDSIYHTWFKGCLLG